MNIAKEKILVNLISGMFARQIHLFEEVPSTQDILRTLIVSGSPEGTIVISETQTEGRGQLGREWISPEGGLWFSIALIPPFGPEVAPQITLLAAFSIVQAISDIVGLSAMIKWPNDIFINGKKVAGILGEMSSHRVAIRYIALGIGINVNILLEKLPPYATSLQNEAQRKIPLEELLASILNHFENNYRIFKESKDMSPFQEKINEMLLYRGEMVKVTSLQEIIQGTVVGVYQDGRLIINTVAEQKMLSSGEIVVCCGSSPEEYGKF
ncbi:biotin--[acetyl-CoA-carboxylase] ligase [Candidatus Desantisbacteria bacterium CG2_30_40_21]|uniref:biotin--[biotin carboxyl-carrier protein] ligase n=3 Tax=unclassified Candidatus Desantisiibacteriota TaxID=3106372 RepID=A0A2M8AW96_9BACT|nr:MAG: biotin--[acetyl-CoA-carboxylase] ligase [Candidatus Desantisbacteria bacterium CG2_30_40_21]PIP39360.1 MAG: biotin--[acetyl-CoA-carboxylase] ligase [Candidatus Desantisbacteria bacterium CG23_combo_of_CG06-09_8_20_14_all_40_23]PJB30475.1 MAG: biotin--[acetyl-CoA-carboxylase] ligase [Candidatus Desantisbacteria bacterium CG_4_9_14_3_um_filter_40_11]